MKTILIALSLMLVGLAQPARADSCGNQSSFVMSSTSGNFQVIPALAGRGIRICFVYAAWNTSASFKFTYGTGTNCATGTTDATAPGPMTAFVFPFGDNSLEIPSGNAVCLNFSTAVTGGGWIKWSYR